MSRPPYIVPDLLTLLTLQLQYPLGFARPHRTAQQLYCLPSLLTNDALMREFKMAATSPRHEADRLILLYPDVDSALMVFFDRPNPVCACGKHVSRHGEKT